MTATPTPTTTTTPTMTPNLAATVVAQRSPRIYNTLTSPDRKWQARVIIYDCVRVGDAEHAYDELRLKHIKTGTEKIADTQLQNCGGLGPFGLAGLFWSTNSRYFYYPDAREGGPDGCGYWERPTIALDTTDWHATYLDAGHLSPDKTKIAGWQSDELVVWDIDKGELARVAVMGRVIADPITWSPDSQTLFYLQWTDYCPRWGKSILWHVDLESHKRIKLLESEKPTFLNVEWTLANEIKLFEQDGKEWRYNLVNRQLKPAP